MIGDMLAKARKSKGMTKTELARVTDINIGHLTHIEKGERNPSHKALRNICKALNMPYQPLMFTYDKEINVEQASYNAIDYISCNKLLAIDKIGDFTSQAGQHCITYVPGETEGEYELYMFNNNFTYSGTRKDIDWSGYTLSQVPVEQRKSYYYKYKINENEKTFKLVDSFEVPYSAYVSSVQKLDDNFIICSGSQKLFGEYDNEGNLLREYQQEKEQYVYRVFKYTFDGIWFTE